MDAFPDTLARAPPPPPAPPSARSARSSTLSGSYASSSESGAGLPPPSPVPSDSPRSVVIDISAGVSAAASPHWSAAPTRSSAGGDGPSPAARDSAPQPAQGVQLLGINYTPPAPPSPPGVLPETTEGAAEGGGNGGAHAFADEKGPAGRPLTLDMEPLTWARHGRDGEPAEEDEDEDELGGRHKRSMGGSGGGSSGDWKVRAHAASRAGSFKQTINSRRLEPPKSSYYFGPPPPDAAYGTDPIGQLGVHHPREIVRVERDYSGGEIVQFAQTYPLEFEGRITPTQYLETINAFNEILISAHSLRHGFIDNTLDIFSFHLARLVRRTHYDREMMRLKRTMDRCNVELFNPVGLNILWPRNVGFLFLEIEYY